MGKGRILVLLFMPFVLNLAVSIALWLLVPSNLWLDNPRKAYITFMSLLQTYDSPFISLIQVVFVLYAVKSLKGIKDMYNKADLTKKSVFIIIGLVLLSWFLFMIEGLVNIIVQGISWEEYGSLWKESIKLTPLWSRLFTLIVGSLTAGIFEEIFWRAYGITMLEDKYRSKMAVML
ncbi:MAG: hypothetical protein QXK95_03040 [Nitrososphaerota archaeon]